MDFREASESLLSLKDYPELISYNDEMYGFNQIETAIIYDHDLQLKSLELFVSI